MHFSFPLLFKVMVSLYSWLCSVPSEKVALELRWFFLRSASASREYASARWEGDEDVKERRI